MNKTFLYLLIAAVSGALLSGLITYTIFSESEGGLSASRDPLYWVAPMNPNYRSNEPGKSPMGMDLIPVYEDSVVAETSPGMIAISPVVENNLGVRTAVLRTGPFETHIRTVGYVRFDEDRLINIHPRVEGWIEELFVKAQGEFLVENQPVYSIYSPTLVAAQEELLLAMDRDNQRLVQSAEERLRALQVPESLIEEVRERSAVQRNVTVYAPQDGLVANLEVREGQFVQPGNQIMSIGVLDEVWVIAEVFERQVSLVNEGDPVNMTLDYLPGMEWQGIVDFIYPTLDEQTRTVAVRLRFRNPGQELKPNMFAQVDIQHREDDEPVLLVPNEAIISTGTQDRVVLSIGDGRYKSVETVLGRRGEDYTEILGGLVVGDRVVISAHFLLDSESSISSDFQRMAAEAPVSDLSGGSSVAMANVISQGTVEHVMVAERMVSVTHQPVPEWDWPAMTMSFELGVEEDLGAIVEGGDYQFNMTRLSGNRIVVSELVALSEN